MVNIVGADGLDVRLVVYEDGSRELLLKSIKGSPLVLI